MISMKCQRGKDKGVTSLDIKILLVNVLVSSLLTSNSSAAGERQGKATWPGLECRAFSHKHHSAMKNNTNVNKSKAAFCKKRQTEQRCVLERFVFVVLLCLHTPCLSKQKIPFIAEMQMLQGTRTPSKREQ